MKTPYTNINDILKDLTTEFNEVYFNFRNNDYCILKIKWNFNNEHGKQCTFWELPVFMVIKVGTLRWCVE
ncbi:MAG: hypothetical protein LBC44_05070 [Mycoplasmataceae bacterium]|nr:hypothetical protein [Mycoplasmataceae bacterium]